MTEHTGREQPTLVVVTDDLSTAATCCGSSILLSWHHKRLVEAFEQSPTGFFIITSGSHRTPRASDQLAEIRAAVQAASDSVGRGYELKTHAGDEVISLLTNDEISMLAVSSPPFNRPVSGGLIVTDSVDIETIPHLRTMIQGRRYFLERIELPLHRASGDWDQAQQAISSVADRAAQFIAEGKDVLIKPIKGDSSSEKTYNDDHSAVIRSLLNSLRMINTPPRYLISDGAELSAVIALRGLRMQRAIIHRHTVRHTAVWICDEPTSKWPGVPFLPYISKGDFALLELVKAWESSQAPPAPMQYRRLGKSALKTSRIILGCMSFGDPQWEGSPWILPEADALPLLKKAYDLGINTWDTADTYSNGQSEIIIGRALQHYNIPRSKVVILSKLYYPVMDDSSRPVAINDGSLVNQMGLSRKHIFEAVEGSLRRLKTSYIDVLQLHRLDRDAEPEEIMSALHDLVRMGKVHYIAGSSMYAWEFARLHYTAKMRGWTPFTSMQNFYNLLYREEEREMNAFCNAEGIGLTPWSPLARGLLGRPYHEKTARSEKDVKTKKWFENDAQNKAIIDRVEQLAKRKACTMATLSTAWLLKKGCAPIVGVNSAKRLEQTLEAFDVEQGLTDSDMRFLEELYRALSIQAM